MADPNLVRVKSDGRVVEVTYRDLAREQFSQTYDHYNPPPSPSPSRPNIPNSVPRPPSGRPIATSPSGVAIYPRPSGMESISPRQPVPRTPGIVVNPRQSGLSKGIAAGVQAVKNELSHPQVKGNALELGATLAYAAADKGASTFYGAVWDDAPQPLKVAQQIAGNVAGALGQPLPGQKFTNPTTTFMGLFASDLAGGEIDSPTQTVEGSPPFTGGQMEGILYTTTGSRSATRRRCTNDSLVTEIDASITGTLYGPISGPAIDQQNTACNGEKLFKYTATFSGFTVGGAVATYAVSLQAGSGEYIENPSVNPGWVRADNQPDTGGDPDPELVEIPATNPPRPIQGQGGFSPGRSYAGGVPKPSTDPTNYPDGVNIPIPSGSPVGVEELPVPEFSPEPTPTPNSTKDPIGADGKATGGVVPSATAGNVPTSGNSGASQLQSVGLAAAVGAAGVVAAELIGEFLGNNASAPAPESFKQKQPPPRPPEVTVKPNCGCNKPLTEKLDKLDKKLDLGGLLGDAGLAALIQQIANTVGVGSFPASVPSNLASSSPTTKTIGNLSEMQLWQVEQLDGLIGQFPNKLEIEHPDGSTIDMDTPNVSEALAEILGMLVGLTVNSSQILHTSSRALHQAGSATQQAFRAAQYAKGNADYLGYKSVESAFPLPLSYSPGKDPFDGFLQESSKTVQNFENVDKDDFRKQLMELLQAAAIIRAVYWRKLSAQEDFGQQIQTLITEQSGFIDARAKDSRNDSDWEAYLKRVEDGFTTGAGGTGSDTPYGRDRSETPNIRDLSLGGD